MQEEYQRNQIIVQTTLRKKGPRPGEGQFFLQQALELNKNLPEVDRLHIRLKQRLAHFRGQIAARWQEAIG